MEKIIDCISINKTTGFFKRTIAGDVKMIVYNNMERKMSWSKRNGSPLTTSKARKVFLCVWLNWKGVVYCELHSQNQTLNSDKYCSLLNQSKASADETRPELANLMSLCQPDRSSCGLAAMSFYTRHWTLNIRITRFQSLKNSLNVKNFNSFEVCKNYLD